MANCTVDEKSECQTINVPHCRNESIEVFFDGSEYQCTTEYKSECKDVIIPNCQEIFVSVPEIQYETKCKDLSRIQCTDVIVPDAKCHDVSTIVTDYRDEIVTNTNTYVVKGPDFEPPKTNCVRTFDKICIHIDKSRCFKTPKVILIICITPIINDGLGNRKLS